MNLMQSVAGKFLVKPPGYVVATLVVAIAGFLNGYDTGSIGAITVMPYFEKQFGQLSPFLRGMAVSLIMLAGVFPSFFAGQLAERYGRLAVIMSGAIVFTLGALLQGAAFQLPMFMTGRALAGIGEGTWMSAFGVYVTEIAPSARRGVLVSVPQLMVTAGICLGYFTAYGSVHIDSSISWRLPFIIQAVLSITLAASCPFLPESPRWLLFHGQRDKADQALKRLDFSAVEAEKDLLGPAAEQRQLRTRTGYVEGLVMIFRRQYASRTTLALFMLGMAQLSGIDGVLYYAPTLFAQAGLPPTTSSFLASGLSAILMLAITIPALVFADRFPRRTVVMVGGLLLSACMLTIGALYASNSVHTTGPARWVVIVLVFVFGLSYCATWGIVAKIYASEIQPAATRSSATCVAQGIGFFANWLVAFVTPIFLANSSFGAYFLFGALCVTTMLVLWAYMPETRGQSLEAIEEAFKRPTVGTNVGKAASLLRRWFGGKNSAGTSPASSAGASFVTASRAESIEMRGVVSEDTRSNNSNIETGKVTPGVHAVSTEDFLNE